MGIWYAHDATHLRSVVASCCFEESRTHTLHCSVPTLPLFRHVFAGRVWGVGEY